MSVTPRLGLPLLMPSQAQKHVTVNESLLRLDALAQLTLVSRALGTPPDAPAEGDAYAIPAGASGAWAGEEGRIAVRIGGGWDFATPVVGWRGFVADEGIEVVFAGGDWAAPRASRGGFMSHQSRMEDHVPTAGASSATGMLIPAGAVVFGVTGRVVETLPGTATAFRLGVAGAADRYGSGIGVAAGAWLRGLTGSPLTYWEDTALRLTADGGSFAGGGSVRLAVHFVEFAIPD